MPGERLGLVLGAGGTVGIAYHVGVLSALEEHAGVRPDDAELVVGTSAGSVIGAYVRSGWSTADFWALARGTHASQAGHTPEELAARRRSMFTPTFTSPVDMVRRGVGSAYVAARSVVRAPGPRVPRLLQRTFPGGLFSMADARRRFAEDLPDAWPERSLYVCAVDIGTGRRVVFGRQGSPPAPLTQAVMASCAIPGLYEPVRMGRMTLVDGGAHSSTNLDLAAMHGCDLIIGVAPMAYDPASPVRLARQLARRIPARSLHREMAFARSRGAEVLLVRPTAAEMAVLGTNMMRREGVEHVIRAAYEATARLVETDRFKSVLADRTGGAQR